MLKIVIFWLEGSKFKKECFDRIGTGSYSIETTEKSQILNQKNDPKKAKIWSWCVFFLITSRVPIPSKQPEFGGFRLFFWLCWGGRLGIGPKWAKRVQNTTKVGIIVIVWGQKSPSSSYSGWSGAYSSETPCMCTTLLWFVPGILQFQPLASFAAQTPSRRVLQFKVLGCLVAFKCWSLQTFAGRMVLSLDLLDIAPRETKTTLCFKFFVPRKPGDWQVSACLSFVNVYWNCWNVQDYGLRVSQFAGCFRGCDILQCRAHLCLVSFAKESSQHFCASWEHTCCDFWAFCLCKLRGSL